MSFSCFWILPLPIKHLPAHSLPIVSHPPPYIPRMQPTAPPIITLRGEIWGTEYAPISSIVEMYEKTHVPYPCCITFITYGVVRSVTFSIL